MPSFRKRSVTPLVSVPVAATVPSAPTSILAATVQESASVPTAALAPQLFSLIDEDDEVSPSDGDLKPRKRRVVDARGEVSFAIDSLGDDLVLRETMTFQIREDTGVSTEVPQLEEVAMDALVRPRGRRL